MFRKVWGIFRKVRGIFRRVRGIFRKVWGTFRRVRGICRKAWGIFSFQRLLEQPPAWLFKQPSRSGHGFLAQPLLAVHFIHDLCRYPKDTNSKYAEICGQYANHWDYVRPLGALADTALQRKGLEGRRAPVVGLCGHAA
jgi:hypothetical protein